MRFLTMAALVSAALVSGCKEPTPVPEKLKAVVQAYIEKDFEYYARLQFDDPWLNEGKDLVCGEFEAPPGLKETKLRYIYYVDTKFGQVEKHSGWVTDSAVSQGIMDTNRRLFNGIWEEHCKPSGPSWYSRTLGDRKS